MNTASESDPGGHPGRPQGKLNRIFFKTESGLSLSNKIMVYIASTALFGMMMVTVVDVVGRYAFNHPIKGAYELVGFLLVVAGPWAIAYCQLQKAHVRVDFLFQRFPQKMRIFLTSFTYLVGLAAFSVLTWRVVLLGNYYLSLTTGNRTDTLGIPIFPFVILLAIGTGMMALVLLFDLAHSLSGVKRR